MPKLGFLKGDAKATSIVLNRSGEGTAARNFGLDELTL